ncbi:chitin binding protein [Plakobranchus ocellatus]|uniref:Chitin binding protein n=1 Tax=Plakobranchus ocellatus TaxID=259542 RepID=A0AAV4BUN3_9GAST|nr:chitin binding protein [Plakobranchus ocellatus]
MALKSSLHITSYCSILSILLICLTLTRRSEGHGYMIDPPARSSMWRVGFSTPVNYNDNALRCGGSRAPRQARAPVTASNLQPEACMTIQEGMQTRCQLTENRQTVRDASKTIEADRQVGHQVTENRWTVMVACMSIQEGMQARCQLTDHRQTVRDASMTIDADLGCQVTGYLRRCCRGSYVL